VERKLVKIVHKYDDGTERILEGKDVEDYESNISNASFLLISHFPKRILKENWKERKSV